jgi:hypothetical protein
MSQLNLMMPLMILLELARPVLVPIITIAVVDLLLFVIALGAGRRVGGTPLRTAGLIGIVVAVGALFVLPWLTHSGPDNLHGWVDYAALTGAAIGLGILAAFALLPPLMLTLGRRRDR